MAQYVFDVEADGLLDTATRLHCAVIMDVATGKPELYHDSEDIDHPAYVGRLADFLDRLSGGSAHLWAGHNINGYDIPLLQKLYPARTFEHLERFDTLVVSRVQYFNLADRDYRSKNSELISRGLVGLHGLEAWGVRLGAQKRPKPDFAHFSREMADYCIADVIANRALFLKEWQDTKQGTLPWVQLEQAFSRCIDSVMAAGVRFDYDKSQELEHKLKLAKLEAEKALQGYPEFGDWTEEYVTPKKQIKKQRKIIFNPTSRKHIEYVLLNRLGFQKMIRAHRRGHERPLAKEREKMRRWLQGCDLVAPEGADPLRLLEITNTGATKVNEDTLEAIEDRVPAAKALATLFMLQKRLSQLRGLQIAMRKDGRIYGQISHNGAVSGRCTHFKPNMTQYPAVDKPYGPEFRACFSVCDGFALVGADAQGLELRGLAHFLAPHDGGSFGSACVEGDPHSVNQRNAGLSTRAQAKTFIYALVYGAGARKLGLIIERGEADGRRLKEGWIKNTPGATEFFESVPAALVARGQAFYKENPFTGKKRLMLKPNAHLRGLDGRPLYIRALHSAPNTLIQSWGAVVMKQTTVQVFEEARARGWKLGTDWQMVLHVHDEFQCEVRKEIADEFKAMVLACFTRAGEILKCRVRIDGDAKVGGSWAETH